MISSAMPLQAQPPAMYRRTANDSPVLELVDYLNQQGIPHGGVALRDAFKLTGGNVHATLGIFNLASRYAPIHDPAMTNGRGGVRAELVTTLDNGRSIQRATLLDLHRNAPGIVAVDRLCRTLHMLNFLASHADAERLWIDVSLQHVLAVEDNHGHFLEQLLYRCGIDQEQVVLIIPALPVADPDFGRLRAALASYRNRGHPVALDLRSQHSDWRLAAIDLLRPDWLYLSPRTFAEGNLPGSPRVILDQDRGTESMRLQLGLAAICAIRDVHP